MELTLITSNIHKYQEMRQRLMDVVDLQHLQQKYPEIQADTNRDIARHSLSNLIPLIEGNFCIEDAGMEIDHFKGFPGPYSSYVLATLGWQGILNLMQGIDDRKARFISTIGLYWEGEVRMFEGTISGRIAEAGVGEHGFGFDPIFIPEGYELTFAELSLEDKNTISHRSRSTGAMIEFLKLQE